MMKSKWVGLDESLETSLFEYGFMMRYDYAHKGYRLVIRYGDQFFIFLIYADDCLNDCIENSGTDIFPSSSFISEKVGIDEEKWIDLVKENPVFLIRDIIEAYGMIECFPDPEESYSEEEIRKKFKKVL